MRDLGLDLRLDDNHLFLTTFEDLRTKSVSNLWKGCYNTICSWRKNGYQRSASVFLILRRAE